MTKYFLLSLTVGLLVINLIQHWIYPKPTKPDDARASRLFMFYENRESYNKSKEERVALKEVIKKAEKLDNIIVLSNIAIYLSNKKNVMFLGDNNGNFFPESSGNYQKNYQYIIYPVDGLACFSHPTYSCYKPQGREIFRNKFWIISKVK